MISHRLQCLDHTNYSLKNQEVQNFVYVTRDNELDWLWLLKVIYSVNELVQRPVLSWEIEMCGPWEVPEIAEMLMPSRRDSLTGQRDRHKGEIKYPCHVYKTDLFFFFFTTNCFQKDKFASAPMIIIGSIPKSSNFYLLHQKTRMGLRIIIYAQLFSSFDFSFDITSWFKAWCTINFLQMCSNS